MTAARATTKKIIEKIETQIAYMDERIEKEWKAKHHELAYKAECEKEGMRKILFEIRNDFPHDS